MKKVIITGGSGFVGYHLVSELCSQGVVVYAVCRLGSDTASRLEQFNNVKLIYCDLDEIHRLPEILSEREFDAFYHLAWEGASGPLRDDYLTQVKNIKWTGMVANVAKELSCDKLIIAGTVCELQCDAILQSNQFIKSSFYLLSKRSAYELIDRLCLKLNLTLVWCAFYHPIGKFNKENQLIANTIQSLLREETPKFGPADQWFDVIAVEDLAHAFVLAGEKQLSKTWYFIGSGSPRVLRAYLERTRELIAPEVPMEFSYYLSDGLPMQEQWLAIFPFSKETGYRPKYSFDEAIINIKNSLNK